MGVVNWSAFAALTLHHRRRPAAPGDDAGIGMVELAPTPDDRSLSPKSRSGRRFGDLTGSSLTEKLLGD